jgi:hypothetical protein
MLTGTQLSHLRAAISDIPVTDTTQSPRARALRIIDDAVDDAAIQRVDAMESYSQLCARIRAEQEEGVE